MTLRRSTTCILLAITSFATAQTKATRHEYTVKKQAFEKTLSLTAQATPIDYTTIAIDPQRWNLFTIESLPANGSIVRKGSKFLTLDTTLIDDQIDLETRTLAIEERKLVKTKLEFEAFKINHAEDLENNKVDFEKKAADFKFFKEVEQPEQQTELKMKLLDAKEYLAYAEEEHSQLLKMYEADNLTEETEKIVLRRAKHQLKKMQQKLAKTEIEVNHELTVIVPRQLKERTALFERAKRDWELYQKTHSIDLEIRAHDLANQQKTFDNNAKKLEKLKHDRALMESLFTYNSNQPARIYYGAVINGVWEKEDASKFLKVGASIPARQPFLTLIVDKPNNYKFTTFLDKPAVSLLDRDTSYVLYTMSNPWTPLSVKATILAYQQTLNNKVQVDFTLNQVNDQINALSQAKINATVASYDSVITIPTKAITRKADGTCTARVKMAESDFKELVLKLGEEANGSIVVLDGLQEDQVVLMP